MMDYYTLQGNLVTFSFRAIVFNPLCALIGVGNWATVPQLNLVEYNLQQYDAYLLQLINQLDIDYQAGDTNLQQQINNINAGAGTLVAELISDITIGGIREGDVFPIGTSLEDIWIQLLGGPVNVVAFRLGLFDTGETVVVKMGEDLVVPEFNWVNNGALPLNFKINDSDGQITDEPLLSNSNVYSPITPYTYNRVTLAGYVQWTLSADNMDDVTHLARWVFPTYIGKEATADDTPVTMTEAKVLAGTETLVSVVDQSDPTILTVSVDVAAGEQGFIAVHKGQMPDYTSWFIDNTNFSNIEVGEFILPPVEVTVNGEIYEIYRWGYRSPYTGDITLKS
jgi:hypothetical protein